MSREGPSVYLAGKDSAVGPDNKDTQILVSQNPLRTIWCSGAHNPGDHTLFSATVGVSSSHSSWLKCLRPTASPSPSVVAPDNPSDIRRALGHVKYRSVLANFLPALTKMSPAEAQQFTQETSSMEDPEFYEAIYARFPHAVIEENGGLTLQRIKAYSRVEDCHRAMAFDYRPNGMVKSVDMFMPDALPFFDVSSFDLWESVMNQWHSHACDIRMHKVAGNHYTVLKKPYIEVFQEALNKALEARGV